jgi:hypothetical protein
VLAQLSGQGRLAVGAILGAATAALFLVGITTGPEVAVGRAELPLAMTDVPGTGGMAVPTSVSTVLSGTISATTTAASTTPTTTVTGPTSVPVVSSTAPSTTTTVPPTTTSKPTRTKRPPTRPPCFLFC